MQKNKLNGFIYPMISYSEEQMIPADQGTSKRGLEHVITSKR